MNVVETHSECLGSTVEFVWVGAREKKIPKMKSGPREERREKFSFKLIEILPDHLTKRHSTGQGTFARAGIAPHVPASVSLP